MEEIGLELGKITPLQFWNNVCNKLNIIPPNNKILNSLWLYNYRQNAVVDRDVLAVLKKLKKSKYPLVAISNTQKAHVKINRKRNLYQYFDFTLLSCEVGLRKPDKAIFVAASKKAHASFRNLIFIDDELRWIKVAKSYGLKTIHFKSAGQLKKELLKLETMKARNDVFKEMFSSDATSPVSYTWAMEFILGFSKAEIKQILRQKKFERKMFYEIERAHEEYMDTGLFTTLDKKFRKPDFDPNTNIDVDGEGGDSGGGDGGFGGGSSLGGGGMDLGGGMDDLGGPEGDDAGGEDLGLDAGGGVAPAPSPGGEPAGEEEIPEEPEANLKEEKTNMLLTKNKSFNSITKKLMEGIDLHLTKIKKEDERRNEDTSTEEEETE
jgi:HAD superfamily hydrolase (TIGR01509 family)